MIADGARNWLHGQTGALTHARTFTMLFILFGMGTFLYFASTVTAVIIEGDLKRAEPSMLSESQEEAHDPVVGAEVEGIELLAGVAEERVESAPLGLFEDGLLEEPHGPGQGGLHVRPIGRFVHRPERSGVSLGPGPRAGRLRSGGPSAETGKSPQPTRSGLRNTRRGLAKRSTTRTG